MHESSTPLGLRLPDDAPLVRKLGHELIAHLPVGVYLCNAQGNVVTFNPKAAEIWGQSPDLEKGPLKYTGAYRIHTEYGAHVPVDKHPMAAVLITEKPITNLRLVIERRDGTEVPVLSSIVPLFDKEGHVIGFMNSLQDLRQQVAQEQVENNIKNALALSQKAELLDKLDSSVVHDFTNHLTSLSMTLSLMEKEVGTLGSEQLQTRLVLCKEAVERTTDLAESLMLFARTRPKTLERIDPNQVLLGMSHIIGNEVGQQIAVDLKLAADASFLRADKLRLESAVLNLVVNAHEAMADGGKLTLSTANAELDRNNFPSHNANFKPGRYVSISVTDTGTGIPAIALEHVFTPFYTTKEIGKNTGLGLTMVKSFVTEMNGQLEVSTRLKEGTSICLFFPCYGTEHSLALTGGERS